MSTRFPGRRFSWSRLTILVLVRRPHRARALPLGFGWWRDTAQAKVEGNPWFGGYVDVTATPSYAFETATAPGTQNAVLAFVVAAKDKTCTPTWGGSYSLDQASSDLDLDRRIARVRDQGRNVVVSFGGPAERRAGPGLRQRPDLAPCLLGRDRPLPPRHHRPRPRGRRAHRHRQRPASRGRRRAAAEGLPGQGTQPRGLAHAARWSPPGSPRTAPTRSRRSSRPGSTSPG